MHKEKSQLGTRDRRICSARTKKGHMFSVYDIYHRKIEKKIRHRNKGLYSIQYA